MCKDCTAAVEAAEVGIAAIMLEQDLDLLRRKSGILKGLLPKSVYNIFLYGLAQATLTLKQDEFATLKSVMDNQEMALIQDMKKDSFDLDSYMCVIGEISSVLSSPLDLFLNFGFIKLINLADPNRDSNDPSHLFGMGGNPLV